MTRKETKSLPLDTAAVLAAVVVCDLLKPSEVAAILRVSVQTLAEWRCNGRHELPYVKMGEEPTGGKILYRRSDIEAFIAKRVRGVAA